MAEAWWETLRTFRQPRLEYPTLRLSSFWQVLSQATCSRSCTVVLSTSTISGLVLRLLSVLSSSAEEGTSRPRVRRTSTPGFDGDVRLVAGGTWSFGDQDEDFDGCPAQNCLEEVRPHDLWFQSCPADPSDEPYVVLHRLSLPPL